MGLRRRPGAIYPRAEKFLEHVVFVGGENQAPNGKTHPAREVAGQDIADIPRWNRKRHGRLIGAGRSGFAATRTGATQPAPEVINDMRGKARQVATGRAASLDRALQFVEISREVGAITKK